MKKKKSVWLEIWQAKYLYLCILPVMIWLAVFAYGPMYGLIIAFKDFKARLGILGSPWVGLDNFKMIFTVPKARQAIANTLLISFGRLIFCFPMGVVVAILLTEMPGTRVKKVYQTALTFPHFLSWVVVANLMIIFLSSDGVVNKTLGLVGIESIGFLQSEKLFRSMLFLTYNWKEMGWGAIIFIAAIAGIDPTLYEAAEVDGASRLKRIWHITLPGIRTTVAIMFILEVGKIMNAGFDQLFNLRNALVENQANILDTYVYDITFGTAPNFGFSTAVGFFKSVVNFTLVITANKVTHWLTGEKMIG